VRTKKAKAGEDEAAKPKTKGRHRRHGQRGKGRARHGRGPLGVKKPFRGKAKRVFGVLDRRCGGHVLLNSEIAKLRAIGSG
jgi:hypothetical protein